MKLRRADRPQVPARQRVSALPPGGADQRDGEHEARRGWPGWNGVLDANRLRSDPVFTTAQ
jgi:hypothetical protein